jgi:hypothetical protein
MKRLISTFFCCCLSLLLLVTQAGGSRVVFYIGTGGGVVTAADGSPNRSETTAATQNLAGGVYRRLGVESPRGQPTFPGWKLMNRAGFGDAYNYITALAVFDGQIYAGASNWVDGGRIWRSANGSHWTPPARCAWVETLWTALNRNGLGRKESDSVFYSNAGAVFQGRLTLGLMNGVDGGEIWRYEGFNVFLPGVNQ